MADEESSPALADSSPDKAGQDRSSPDRTGQVRTGPDRTGQDRRVTIDEAVLMFEERGLPRSKRSIRRYCQRDRLDCKTLETASGLEPRLISVKSIDVFIEEQKQIYEAIRRWPGPDRSGQDRPSPDRTGQVIPSFYQETLDLLKGEITVKNNQLQKKDEQIGELLERDRETHILIQQLQKMLVIAPPKDVPTKPAQSEQERAGEEDPS